MRQILSVLLLSSIVLLFQACDPGVRSRQAGPTGNMSSSDLEHLGQILEALNTSEHRNTDSVIKLLNGMEQLSQANKADSCLAEVLLWRGNLRYEQNRYQEARSEFEAALDISRKNEYFRLQARCLERLASVHLATDDPHLALNLYFESLALAEKVKDSAGMAKVYNVLGIYKLDSGEPDTAEVFLLKALDINKRLKDRRNMIENEGNLGYLYQQSNRPEKADSLYHSLINELESNNEQHSLPVIFYNLASLHQSQDQLDSALFYLSKATTICSLTGDTSMLSVLNGNRGEILMMKGEADSARYYLKNALAFAEATDDVETQLQAISFLIKVDTADNQHEAIGFYNRYLVLQDSVYQRKIRHSHEASELSYQNEKKRMLIESQHATLQSSQKENRLYFLILMTTLFIGVLLARVIYLQRRTYSKSKQLLDNQILLDKLQLERMQQEEELNKLKLEKYQEELRVRESELVSIALGIEKKNELLDLISKKINDTMKKGGDVDVLQQIVNSIRNQIDESEDADLFNQRFATLHKEFFTNLQAVHPDLTKTELKFCAYLRVQLSSSQIAHIMNVTNEAIRKTRYRIRKKLGLPVDASLESYIMKF